MIRGKLFNLRSPTQVPKPIHTHPPGGPRHTDPPCARCAEVDRARSRLRNRILRRVAKALGVDDLRKPGERY